MLKCEYNDFDHFSEEVGGGDFTMTLCSLKQRFWSLNVVNLPGAQIQLGYNGSGNMTEGTSDPGGAIVYVPLSNEHTHQAINGEEFSDNSCVILNSGSVFDLCIRGRHEWCSVFVNSRDLPGSDASAVTANHGLFVNHWNSYDLRLLKVAVRTIISVAQSVPEFESSPAGEKAAYFLQRLLGRIVTCRPGQAARQPTVRLGRPRYDNRDIIVRCRSALQEHPRSRLQIKDLVRVSQVSERTLRNAFNSYFGVGPHRYLQIMLIRSIHQDLLHATPDYDSVTKILLRHGVWEFGHFASKYRRVYGEVPSVTLRRH